jgi:hypothetical protein
VRISHSELGSCRSNPTQWVAGKLSGGREGFSYGYNQAVKGAIFTYHRTNDLTESRRYLAEKLRRFANESRKTECTSTLRRYLAWAESSGLVVSSYKVRINLPLHGEVLLGGEISRVDIDSTNDRYLAILLGARGRRWKEELRFPLIQYAIASQFHRPLELVSVGFQDLDGANLETTQYGTAMVRDALDEGMNLGRVVEREIGRFGGAN